MGDYLEKLKAEVPADWWASEDGQRFLNKEHLIEEWVEFLDGFGYDCFFTLTFREPASSSILAIDRAAKLLSKFGKSIHFYFSAFIVAEQHKSGMYHVHGLLRLGALDSSHTELMLEGLWRAGFEKFGRCSFQLVKDGGRVRAYVSKYLVKKVCDHRFVGMQGKSGELV